MTDISLRDSAAPDLTQALPALMPALRGKTNTGWAINIAIAVIALAVLAALVGSFQDHWQIILFIVGAAVVGFTSTAIWVRREHEKIVMPLLAKTIGMQYRKGDKSFLDTIPPRLLPKTSRRKVDDALTGSIGGRNIRMAEVKVETGGKNSHTLFKGIVFNFPNLAPMPPFFLADQAKTRGWAIFGGNIRIDDLAQIDTRISNNRTYGVWASSASVVQDPALHGVLNVLTTLHADLGHDMQLFSASSDGQTMHIALSCKNDLFSIGGMFTPAGKLLPAIERAYRDLTIPLTLASRLLAAEAEAVKTTAGRNAESH